MPRLSPNGGRQGFQMTGAKCKCSKKFKKLQVLIKNNCEELKFSVVSSVNDIWKKLRALPSSVPYCSLLQTNFSLNCYVLTDCRWLFPLLCFTFSLVEESVSLFLAVPSILLKSYLNWVKQCTQSAQSSFSLTT